MRDGRLDATPEATSDGIVDASDPSGTRPQPSGRAAGWSGALPHVPDTAVDVAIVVLCTALGITTLDGLGGVNTGQEGALIRADWLGSLVLVLGVAPVLVRRRWPLAATVVSASAYAVLSVTDEADRTAWLLAVLACAYMLSSLGAERERRIGLGAVAVAALLSATIGMRGYGDDWLARVRFGAFELVVFGVVWYLGAEVRRRRLEEARLEVRATRAEADAARAEAEAAEAAAHERARIARELHDLVGHAISVISVQATVGEHLAATDPEQARAALATIQSVSKEAMVEMRHLVGVLRSDDGTRAPAELAPQPGLADLDDLLGAVRASGVEATLTTTGGTPVESPGLGLAVYRIVQEALANAGKHAPGAAVTVTVDHGTAAVTVTVENDPATAAGRARAAAAGSSVDVLGSSGYGLVGMAERVAVYGGSVEHGTTADGGFRVRAVLPYGGEARP